MKKDNQNIIIKGAKVHNLKNISLEIPRNKLIVVTGVSGSGKSSLAFDTLHAEGQRRYIESFSVYARQFLGMIDKPDVEKIEGLPPTIAISQQVAGKNSRSTVGTMTEIYDFLRILFSKIGKPHCPHCGVAIQKHSLAQIVKEVMAIPSGTKIFILSQTSKKLESLKEGGFNQVRINGKIYKVDEALKKMKGVGLPSIEVVIDSFVFNKKTKDRIRVIDSIETALKMGDGFLIVQTSKNRKTKDSIFSNQFFCQACKFSLAEIDHRLFSFNSPQGACSSCLGLGVKLEIAEKLVIPNPRLSLAEGAVRPGIQMKILESLASKYKFSLNVPVKDLSKKILNLVFSEGIVPDLERRYKETSSDSARAEIEKYMITKVCPQCKGKRLKPVALGVTIANHSIDDVVKMPINELIGFFRKIETTLKFKKNEGKIIKPIIKSIKERTQLLIDVNLEYLNLSRGSASISAGESQRIRLATQISSKLTGVVYILDEPSVGLHPKDQEKLIHSLKNLREMGNTVIVVEHDEETIKAADWIIDIGPMAGEKGGRIIFEGSPADLKKSSGLTGKYLSKKLKIESGGKKKIGKRFLTIKGAKEHNLKNIDTRIPLGTFTCVTGASGSGKSTLINDILAKTLRREFYQAKDKPGLCKNISGTEDIDKVVIADQSPIGKTPRSNPATYTGVFTLIRDIFAKTKDSKRKGYQAKHFSFNLKGGRCEECQGTGFKKIEMYFLPDKYIECPECHGQRYTQEILEIKYKGANISEVLEMSIGEALKFFQSDPNIKSKLLILKEIGLDYIKLGQSAPSFSGGEAQRIKLGTELSKKATGKTIYMLDEPTTGLHSADIKNLLSILKKLTDKGNTVLVIEHNLDIIKSADWIIDLGPEGGDKGGYIMAEGSPSQVAKVKKSYTGQWLKK